MKRFLLLFLVVLLSGCATAETQAVASATPTPVLSTASPTASSTPLPTVTVTATVTPTPSPTATPTPALPVSNGTPLPALEHETITAENFMQLEVVARYGYPSTLWETYRLIENGKTVVVGMVDGVAFYDAKSGKQIDKLPIDGMLRSYAITPDGRFVLALAGDKLFALNRSGKLIQSFDASTLHNFQYWKPAPFGISSDGNWVAIPEISDWGHVEKTHIFRIKDGQELTVLPSGGQAIFSPDGTRLVVLSNWGGASVPYLYQTETWQKTGKLSMCENVDCYVTFSPDGSLLALAYPDQVIIYTSEGKTLQWLKGWKSGSQYDPALVNFSNNNQFVAVYSQPGGRYAYAQKPTALVFDLVNNQVVAKQEMDYKALVWPDDNDGAIQVFDYLRGEKLPSFGDYPVFAVSDDGVVSIGNTEYVCRNEACEKLDGRTVFDQQFNRYTIEEDGNRTLVKDSKGTVAMSLPFKVPHLEEAWMSDGYLVMDVCKTETRDGCFGTVFNPNGKQLYLGDYCSLPASRQGGALVVSCYANNGYSPAAFLISPNGLKKISDYLGMPLISPDFLFSVYDEWWQVGDVVKERQLLTYTNDGKISAVSMPSALHRGQSFAATFFPNGQAALVDVDGYTCTTTGDCKWLGGSSILAIAFSPNGHLLATYGDDGFIRVWAVRRK